MSCELMLKYLLIPEETIGQGGKNVWDLAGGSEHKSGEKNEII